MRVTATAQECLIPPPVKDEALNQFKFEAGVSVQWVETGTSSDEGVSTLATIALDGR